MQQEFLQYAKESLTNDNVPFTLTYEPRKGDGRVLKQGVKIPGLTEDLITKDYYLTLTPDAHNQRELCQPFYSSKKYAHIPDEGFEWLPAVKPKIISKEVDIVDWMELTSNRRTYELFTIEDDIQEGDIIKFKYEDQNGWYSTHRTVSSVNRLVWNDEIRDEELLIASLRAEKE